jgi:sulfur carrier protein ThiS
VPAALVKAANERYPGGEVIGGEKEWAGGRIVWEVVKTIDGQTWEILVSADGEVMGGEYYHVKVMKNGDSLRVGVSEDGKVVRVVRRVPGQVRVPR